jgi:MFS family permease
LPAAQTEFAVDRAAASLPFTLAMFGFAVGGVLMGWLSDRFGIIMPVIAGAVSLALGYIGSGYAPTLWLFAAAHILIGFGSSATLGPLMSDMSHWFVQRRGLAVTICSSGNYVAGTIWPPVVQHFIASDGLRATQVGIGIFCVVSMVPIALLMLRARAPLAHATSASWTPAGPPAALGVSPAVLQVLLCVAGVACCVAMAMPQVHLVAYCSDLGYGPAHGADMLAAMMGFGIISRVMSGVIADRIGGLATLLISSALQGLALFLYLLFNGLTSLYVISALFGLFQGGLIPMYAVVVREYFSPREVGTRVGLVLMATLAGMAFGGWVSGWIFDLTGSYRVAFVNGLLWNFLNLAIVAWLMLRRERLRLAAA